MSRRHRTNRSTSSHGLRLAKHLLVAGGLALCFGPAWAGNPDSSQLEFFEQRIRPILVSDCYECHGAAKQKGGLRVDFRDGLRRGGDSGPAIVPGDARHSLLIQSIAHTHPDSRMPKDRPKLADPVVADFEQWVNQGAPDPRNEPPGEFAGESVGWESVFNARREWWSFQPVRPQPVPAVKNAAWSDHPVDRFLLAKLEDRGLEPAAPADRRTLLRRVTFALTGLPPTPEEIQNFLADESPDAFTRVVDRLLNSPRFGERWARHWMDLTRFAETHGSEADPEIPHAWRYRDYLIRALNADVPWDQLIREHIAGDLLPQPRLNLAEGVNESLLGLAHLRLVEHGFQPVDTLDEQVKTVDNQIDVISKAFQGLTTSCARCHDHKFDPISQRDYFALYGILASSRPAQLTVDLPEKLRVHRAGLERLKKAIKSKLADAWEKSATELTEALVTLAQATANQLTISGDEPAARIAELERQVGELERAGRAAVLQQRGVASDGTAIASPAAAWTFEGDARDVVGGLDGELLGGAVIRDGRLVLDGHGAFLRTSALTKELGAKTLEAWVATANLEQRGGGVLTVEAANGGEFDSLVFAEQEPRKWLAGSDNFHRTRGFNGPEETAAPGELIHLALVYQPDNSIALYRNGAPHGTAYTPSGDRGTLRTFDAGKSRVLLGMRHTGGGNAYFAGQIEEARLYDRALTSNEVSASFHAGPGLVSAADIDLALTPEQRDAKEQLLADLALQQAALAEQFPNYAERDAARTRMLQALAVATKNEAHPLHIWQRLRRKGDIPVAQSNTQTAGATGVSPFHDTWQTLIQEHADQLAARQQSNAEQFSTWWDATRETNPPWFKLGVNPPEHISIPGEFVVEPESDRILTGLLPAGVFSHRLSQKHNGVFTSPRFKVTSDSISLLVVGGKGARVRLIPDNYPIGAANIFPQATLNSDAPIWVRLDTAYRKGVMAHLEFVTAEDSTSRERTQPGAGGRSFFGVTRVVFHDTKTTPKEELLPLSLALHGATPGSIEDFTQQLGRRLNDSISAWRANLLTEEQRLFLDSFVRAGLLPATLPELSSTAPLTADYRRLEGGIPTPRRAPGVLETTAYDAPLLSRGDHLQPLDPVPRGYLPLVHGSIYETKGSGRLELAADLTREDNPLTTRVMVNRIWHHLFGCGLVPTVDNFGRLGDTPTHPELLDHLASRFVEKNWSLKDTIRFLVTTRAWQMASEPSPHARELDPANELLSHARVRRLEAEAIRDSLLAVSGRLDTAMFGPGANALAPANEQQRRSVYLMIRRNFLSPFLEVFDAPRPFSTLGRRDATNVPGQSLALLNDPFVSEQAGRWAEALIKIDEAADARTRRMFEQALGRLPDAHEAVANRAYLADLEREHGRDNDQLVWRDFAQSLFNLKEFIYVR